MKKSHIVFFLVLIAGFAVLLRCLHLLNPDHYYIVSVDSHFFHWQAEKVLSGQSILLRWHGGLTYPLAYSASFISFVSGQAPREALTLAGKLLPPVLAVVSIAVVYLGTSKMYGPRAGLWAAAAWAIFNYTLLTQVSGYLDRDGLSLLLVMSGVFLFYFGSRWHFRVAGKDVGWALGAASVAAVCAFLYLEWLWLGPLFLLIVVGAFVVAEGLVDLLLRSLQTPLEPKDPVALTRGFLRNAAASIGASSWRPLAVLLGLVLAMGIIYPGLSSLYRSVTDPLVGLIISDTANVAELERLTADDIFGFGFLIIPLVLGFYIALTRHRRADLLCLGWVASLFFTGLFATRIFIYSAPAICIITGLGLASIFSFRNVSKAAQYISIGAQVVLAPSLRSLKICGAVVLLILLISVPTYATYSIGSSRLSADNAWQSALAYMKENTPEDSVVITWWDYGYWILDMGDRRPVVDNGLYGWDDRRLEDVALVYCTSQASEAVRVMRKYGADYVVFSKDDVAILPNIAEYGLGEPYGDGTAVPEELQQSLFYRSLYGNLLEEAGLTRVYPAHDVESPEVVILALR